MKGFPFCFFFLFVFAFVVLFGFILFVFFGCSGRGLCYLHRLSFDFCLCFSDFLFSFFLFFGFSSLSFLVCGLVCGL